MWSTVGYQPAVTALRRALSEARVSHAYLFAGPRNVGKMALALDLARALNCSSDDRPCGECAQCRRVAAGLHPDVRILGLLAEPPREGRSRVAIGIEQVREVRREASLKPFEGRFRVFIFDGAEHLSEEAANSLLKVLEEPPQQVIMVLLAADADALLPTIASRCQRLDLRPLPVPLVASEVQARCGVAYDRAQEIARLSGGRLGWALTAAKDPGVLARRAERLSAIEGALAGELEERFSYATELAALFGSDREEVRQELELWVGWWRDVLVIRHRAPELVVNVARLDALGAWAEALSTEQVVAAVKDVQQAARDLERNINPRLALEELMLQLPRL